MNKQKGLEPSQRTTNPSSPRISKRASIQANKKIILKNKYLEDSKFIDLSAIIEQSSQGANRVVTHSMKNI